MFNKIRAALGGKSPSGGANFSWLIVGLGNPGAEYEGNRHNIGFMVLDKLAGDWRKKYQGLIAEADVGGNRVLLLKPQTYMNKSGLSVAAAANFYKIPAERIVVLHDELDLALGKMRTKQGGGHAGHNGLRSIDADFGNANYHRVRIGIGHPGDKNRVSGYVLSDFAKDEMDMRDAVIDAIADHIDLFVNGKDTDFMTKVSQKTKVN